MAASTRTFKATEVTDKFLCFKVFIFIVLSVMMILMTMHDEHAAILFKILQGLPSLHRSVKQRVKIADDHHEKTEKGRLIGANRSPPVVQGIFEENGRHEIDN